MAFDATPLNMTTLLVVALAVIAIITVIKGRYASNIPLLFYAATVLLTTFGDRSINPYLFYSGLVLALLLRYEFMNQGFTKFIGFLASGAIGLIVVVFLGQVFGQEILF